MEERVHSYLRAQTEEEISRYRELPINLKRTLHYIPSNRFLLQFASNKFSSA